VFGERSVARRPPLRQSPARVPRLAPRLALLLAALLFSTGGAAIKLCTLEPAAVAGARSLVAALFLLAVRREARRRPSPRALLVGLVYGTTMVLFVLANRTTTAASAVFLQSTAPLWVLLFAPLFLGERRRPRDFAVLGIVALGLLALTLPREAAQATAPDPGTGKLLGTAAGVTWALTLIGLRALGRAGGRPFAALVAGNLLVALGTLPWIASLPHPTLADLLILLWLGVFQIGSAYLLLAWGLGRVPAFEASLLVLVEPVLAPLWAFAIHGEATGPWALAGGLLILAAGILQSGGAKEAGPDAQSSQPQEPRRGV
jgi:drug/metabolite transporter (DMT)-like permease